MSETKQTEYTVDDFQAIVQQALNVPEFAEYRAQCLAFFQEDAAQFESKVAAADITQVKRIFKLIKELDPPAFKLLKSMRTAIGLLDESFRANLHQNLKEIRADLKADQLSASAAHALIYLMVLDPLRLTYLKSLQQLQEGESNLKPNYPKLLAQDPQGCYWLCCFISAYIILVPDCDPAHWNLVSEGDEIPKVKLERNWLIAFSLLTQVLLSAQNKA